MRATGALTVGGVAARRTTAARGPWAVNVAFYLIVIAMLSGLWRVAVRGAGGAIAGYSPAAITWYIATTEAVTTSMRMRFIDDLGNAIGTGAIATDMLRPARVLAVRAADELGGVLPRLALTLAIGWLYSAVVGRSAPSGAALVLAAAAAVLAVMCNLAGQLAFSASAFWLRDAGAAWYVYWKFVFVIGGMLIPLEMLPGWLRATARWLPFRAMAYAPGRLASGFVEPWLLVEQVAWLAVLSALAFTAFAAGERRMVREG